MQRAHTLAHMHTFDKIEVNLQRRYNGEGASSNRYVTILRYHTAFSDVQ